MRDRTTAFEAGEMGGQGALLDALRAAVDRQVSPPPPVRRALVEETDPAVLRKAGRLLAKLRPEDGELRPVRVGIVASCTVGSFQHLLHAALIGAGTLPTLEQADYGAFEMTLATASFTANGDPDVVACLLDETYFLPADWSAIDVDALGKHVEGRLDDLRGLVAAACSRSSATLVLHTIPLPAQVRDMVISWRARASLGQLWHRLNAGILGMAEELRQVAAVDLVGALADAPFLARDDRLHRYADMPYTDGALHLLADQVRRVVQARAGLSRKVLALDLDNTLWGGVLGEVGAHGVQLGGLYPGNCYLDLQRAADQLRRQGVILVLASKNDPQLVEEALTAHPEVLLRPESFSVSAVAWTPKADSLRRAAESLSLSTGSLVFMDDSPFERGHVSDELPDVALVDSSGDPAHLVRALLRTGWFDVVELTETDRQRPELYRSRALRTDFSSGFGSSEDYLHALGIELTAEPVSGFSVARVAQLAARTNQFNLTGVRFDEATTTALSADPGHLVAAFSVSDRFGDEGIVGAAWVQRGERTWRVLNLVLSCRVLGRGVELAIADWLAGQARAAGAAVLEGRFVPSRKNGVAAGFWPSAGFARSDPGADGADGEAFALDLSSASGGIPAWIALRERSGLAT
ncbi:MAG: HAD-IIIC family phosphatase [Frankiaceae bacterium]